LRSQLHIDFNLREVEEKINETTSAFLEGDHELTSTSLSVDVEIGSTDADDYEVAGLAQAEEQYSHEWTSDDLNYFESERDLWRRRHRIYRTK